MAMKVRLLRDIAVPAQHGLRKGRVMEAKKARDGDRIWVKGDVGTSVQLLPTEYELVERRAVRFSPRPQGKQRSRGA